MIDLVTRPPTSIGALGEGPSVLGESTLQIPIGGTVRAGIMVLTKKYAENERAQQLYERGVAAGKGFRLIERVIRSKLRLEDRETILIPKNVPYFTVRPDDFGGNPHTANAIWEQFSEEREVEGMGTVKEIFRLPIVLPTDSWQANMPHALKEFSGAGIKHWSEYSDDGVTRICLQLSAVEVDPKAKRAIKPFGGRKGVPRPNDETYKQDGRCVPEQCPQYQKGDCKLSGKLLFYIPGIAGSSCIQLQTTSFYAMRQWRQTMELVSYLRGGRIAGRVDGKPLFVLTKEFQEVSSLDPKTGESVRRPQWITILESTIDMTASIDASREDPSDTAALLSRDEHDIEGDWTELDE